MEVHTDRLRVRIEQVLLSQRYNYSTKRPKLKENQLGILKIYAFCQINQQRASAPAESTAEVNICENTPIKVAASFLEMLTQLHLVIHGRPQLECSSHIVQVGVKATC